MAALTGLNRPQADIEGFQLTQRCYPIVVPPTMPKSLEAKEQISTTEFSLFSPVVPSGV